ncbi:MAG: DNA polymerase III subunit alpha [Fidelibacterota bacterium]|nr:MAG: DNA polymerase III subunit alpha [Candidatus Neomarinimicrobiota bacterium]
MADFVHLHNHSDFSLLDGAQSVNTIISTLSDLKMDRVAITEHGNLFSLLPFYQAANTAGINPIIGCEAYVAKGDHRDKQTTRGTGWGYHHLVLLAQNETGLSNLIKLVSIGYLEGFYYRPRMDKALLRKHSEGLICMSACLKGEVQEYALSGDMKATHKAALELAEIFPGRFYLELQRHDLSEEDAAREVNIKLARELDLPLVATNDCHYARKEHWEAHDVMFCLGTGKDRDDPNRRRYATPEFYLKSVDEMYQLFKDIPEALENTVAIAEQCSVELDLGRLHLPQFPIPTSAGTQDPDEYLRILAEEGLERQYKVTPEIKTRLDLELQVIRDMGYAGYFLIVMDFIRYARNRDIPVGPGRGSAAGSLAAYALGITNVDPIRYNLLFERFLNPERISMPDIDIDFCQERRGEVIEYVRQQYGENAVSQIITFGKMKARSVVRDVARVLGLSFAEGDRIAKLIPDNPNITIDEAVEANAELIQAESVDQAHRNLFAYSRVLEGMNRHASTHAAGVVIAPGDLINYVPLYRNPKTEEITTQVDMNGLEALGLLKMDFLGLRTLTVIDKTLKMLKARDVKLDIDKIPSNDEATFELFSRGQTIGVFQFESGGMREFLKKLRPTCIEDLIAMNALHRPGPMAYVDEFIDRKHGRREIAYLHPALEPILNETYGIIVYQEQVMQIANAIAGFSLAQADILRRAMGKKKPKGMARMKADFLSGASENSVVEDTARDIFELMARFAKYGFNKSHSTAYALVAYQTAYLKAHYPSEFMAANLSSEMNNQDRVRILLAEVQAMGLEVLPPDVNHSGRNFRVDSQGRIRFGLNAIKHVGQKAADHIKTIREAINKGWKTLPEFAAAIDLHLVNRKALECLVKSGACDSLEGTRHQKFTSLDETIKYAQGMQSDANPNQESLFGSDAQASVISEPSLQQVPPWSDQEHFEMEKELTNFYLTGHPLQAFEEDLREFSNYDFTDPQKAHNLEQLRLGGIISQPKRHQTRKGLPMAFFTLEGLLGDVEVVVFSDLYTRVHPLLTKDNRVFVIGRISTRGLSRNNGQNSNSLEDNGNQEAKDGFKMLAEDIILLEELRQRMAKRINLRLYLSRLESGLIQQLRSLSDHNRGECELWLHVADDTNSDGLEEYRTRRIRSTDLRVSPAPVFLSELRGLIGDENVWISS